MRRSIFAAALVALTTLTARAQEAVEKPVKTLVGAVRYGKDDVALKQMDGDAQGAVMLGAEWGKATAEQRKEFATLFHGLFAAMAFPRIKENLEHLETTLFEKPAVEGEKAGISGTLVILHPLKKQELKVKFDAHKSGGAWKVVDVTLVGTGSPSMLSSIRDEQVQPLFKAGGWDKLLGAMRDRLAQLKKAAAK